MHECHLDLRVEHECDAPPRALHLGDAVDEELDAPVDGERSGL
jgi:hypothetical protein